MPKGASLTYNHKLKTDLQNQNKCHKMYAFSSIFTTMVIFLLKHFATFVIIY